MNEGQLGITEEVHATLVDCTPKSEVVIIDRQVLLELIARAESGDRTAFVELEALVR
jgi:hypothetical protein